MKQKVKLLKLVERNPGLTATGYSKLMGFNNSRYAPIKNNCNEYYKPATILKELHRFANETILIRKLERGMLYGKAWRFYYNYACTNVNQHI